MAEFDPSKEDNVYVRETTFKENNNFPKYLILDS